MLKGVIEGSSVIFPGIDRYRTFIKYCLVGCVVTGVDFAIFTFCYYELHFGSIGSKLPAFGVAVIVSYVLNRTWTFRSSKNVRQQLVKFLSVSVTGAWLSSLSIYFLIDALSCNPLLANGITSGTVLTWNFLANKYWTFRV